MVLDYGVLVKGGCRDGVLKEGECFAGSEVDEMTGWIAVRADGGVTCVGRVRCWGC